MRTKFLQTICLLSLMIALPSLALGDNLTVKITAGGSSTTQTAQPSLEAALNGISLPTVTAIEVSAGTFTEADWLYLRTKNIAEVGLIALANFSITDGIDAVADMPNTDGEHPYFSSMLSTFSAHKLQKVGKYAFYNCSKMSNVNMPDVVMVDERAFGNTTGLKQINLPQLETVGMYAFVNCGIESLTLPKAKTIGNYAFMSAGNLTTLKLPSVTTITAQKLFYGSAVTYLGLSSRPTLSNPKNNTFEGAPSPRYLLMIDANGNALNSTDSATLANSFGNEWQGFKTNHSRLPISLTITHNKGKSTKTGTGNTLEEAITNAAIALSNIEKITITAGEILATDWLWLRNNKNYFSNLTHFTVTDGITAVSNIPSSNASVLKSPLEEFSVAKLNILGTRALYNIASLLKVNLPQTTVIEQQVFAQCTRLHDVSIPQVITLQGRAFNNCGSLTTLHLPKITSLKEPNIFDGSALTYLKLGATPISITGNVLEGCPSPRFVVLVDQDGNELSGLAKTTAENKYKADNNGYKNKLWYGFRIDDPQKKITVNLEINNGTTVLDVNGSTLENAISPVSNKASITSIEIVAGEITAADWVYLCKLMKELNDIRNNNLKKLIIADVPEVIAVSDIPAANNYYNIQGSKLEEVSLAKVERLGYYAFTKNSNLKKANFPHVKKIDTYAFLTCSTLDTISIPQIAEFNGSGVFSGSAITYMKIGATPPVPDKVSKGAFSGCNETRFLIFCNSNGELLSGPDLDNARDAYRNDAGYDRSTKLWYGWNIDITSDSLEVIINNQHIVKETHIIACLDSAAKLGVGRNAIESIEVTKGKFTGSDWSHLRDNRRTLQNLKKFVISNSITSVEQLNTITAPNGKGDDLYLPKSTEEVHIAKMTSIGQSVFYAAQELKYINLPNLNKVETSVFYNIKTLEKISLPKVQSVRGNFLRSCSNIKVMQLGASPISMAEAGETFCSGTPNLKYIQIVDGSGTPLTGQALENAKVNYKNDVSNYDRNESGSGVAYGKWRGWILGTTVKISTDDVENGSLSVPLDLVLRDTLSDNTISINISADANYRLKEGSLRAYNTDDESEEVTINGNNTFTLPDFDVTITAEFEPITYEIVATANPTEGGSIGGTGTFIQGASTMLTATPNEGYSFVGWTENGATYSTETSISIADIAANRTFVAEFAQKTYTLTYIAGANGTLEGGSPQTQPVVHGQNANPVEAKANSGYHFKKWSDGSTQNPRTLENVTKDSTITAEFEQDTKTFEITATAEPAEGGSVDGGGTYNENTTATLTATANAKDGYKFVGWEENGNVESTDAEYSFTVKSNRTLVAKFKKITYTLTYTAGEGGKIKHNGAEQKNVILSVEHGADGEEVEAVAENGYKFIGWSDGGSNAVRTDKGIIENKTITAEFELEVVPTFNIIAEAYPAEGGAIDGDGTLNENGTAELVATPNHGYFFVEWTENGASISTENTLSFSVTQDRNLTAVFDSVTYTLTYTASEGGSINGELTLTQQVKFTKNGTEVVAVPNVGYRFVGWSDIAATTPNRTDYNVRGNVDATAMFEQIPPTHTITAMVNPTDAGTVNGAGDYEQGTDATLTATANIGFAFTYWSDGVKNYTENPYTFEVTSDSTFTAYFEPTEVYTISAIVAPADGGVVVGEGQYNKNDMASLTATPNEGFRFMEWRVGGVMVSNSSIYKFAVTGNVEVTAVFEPIPTFIVAAVANPADGGTIRGNGTYFENDEVVLTAIPAAHYNFVSWKLNGSVVSTSKQYTIDHITSNYNNGELVAEFEYDATITVYTITATAEPTEGGSVSGDGEYNENAPATLVATANEGYRFVRWTVAGNEVSTNANFSFTVTSDSTFVAEFEVVPTYTITVDATPAEGGSVSGGGTYNENTTATLTATASNGYKFVRWTEKGVEVSIEPSFSVKVTADSTFVAEFVEDGSIVTVTYAINIGTFENGSVTADKMEATENDVVTLTVSPAANYRLNEIKVNDGAIVVTPTENGNVYTFIMPAMDVTVTAVFEEIPCYAEPSEFTAIACQNYEWDGRTYTESGDYPWTYTTAAGCDSTVTLHLTIGQPQTGEFTAFYTNSYEWEGETYTESGDYTRTFTTVAGCDSIVTLHLTITHSEETSVNVAVAETLNIYPNPTAGVVQVDMPSADASEVLVFNANGQLLQIIKTQGQAQARIDLSELPSGMYFVRIGNALGKVVKQ